MPLKRAALALVDRGSDVALRVGALNTLVREDDGVIRGENFDVGGIAAAWRRKGLPEEGPVVVLGTGGAAAAALVALDHLPLTVMGRSPEAATQLAARVGVDAAIAEWGAPAAGATIVNATPIGMGGESLPRAVVEGAVALFDMPYRGEPTPAVAEFGSRPFADGIDMLLSQAGLAFRAWTGAEPPWDAMEAAARG